MSYVISIQSFSIFLVAAKIFFGHENFSFKPMNKLSEIIIVPLVHRYVNDVPCDTNDQL